MSSPASEIPWETLQQITASWTGKGDDLAAACALPGGFINTTLKLTTRDGSHAVLKITPHRVDPSYEAEAFHLDHLRSLGLPTPRVIRRHTGTLENPFSYLLMEFVAGVDLVSAKASCDAGCFDSLQSALGEMIATMHSATAAEYGLLHFKSLPAFTQWHLFFQSIFDPVLKLAVDGGLLSKKHERHCAKIHDRLDRLLDHGDEPRLVHWDIWSSNVLATPVGGGGGAGDKWRITAILDPGCRYAHAEAELAYIDLFQTGNKAFFASYQQTHRICAGYHQVRKLVYQLYFLLNHLQLFGLEYLARTSAAVDRVAALV